MITATSPQASIDPAATNSARHIDELQTLRGIAALVVVISHVSTVYALPKSTRVVVDAIFNAHASVVVFFVLSGYVLAGSLNRRGLSAQSIIRFYVARLFRLFPALWVASGVSVLLLALFPQTALSPQESPWMSGYLHGIPSFSNLVLALFAINNALIMPVGTVFVEVLGSLTMPVFASIGQRDPRVLSLLLAVLGLAAYPLSAAPHRLDTLCYLLNFGMGAFLAQRKSPFSSRPTALLIASCATVLIFFRCFWFALTEGHFMTLQHGYGDPTPMLVEAMAASVLVATVAKGNRRSSFLTSHPFVWLGDVSYSLYLFHFPVTIAVAKLLSGFLGSSGSPILATMWLLPLTLAVSLSVSNFTFRFVETPCNSLGKRLSLHL